MANSESQKSKLLHIASYLHNNSDENHYVTTSDIINMLAELGIKAERKSIYSDIEILKNFGMDINIIRGRNGGFNLITKTFELAELKLLVDIIQSSKFITQKKSYQLIKKLGTLASSYERRELKRNVFISNRIKNENESIYYSTDIIYKAINENKQIEFLYFNYGPDKQRKYHNNRQPIKATPLGLHYDSEKYYLIAHDTNAKKIKHYRVDKMCNVELSKLKCENSEYLKQFDIVAYVNSTIKMFSGVPEQVLLKCHENCIGAVIDRFGKKTMFIPWENNEYTVTVDVALTPTFYSWIFTFGSKIQILAPSHAVSEYRHQLAEALSVIRDTE